MGRPAVLKVDIVADARGVGSGVSEAEGKLGRLGKVAGGIGAAVAGGLVAAGAAVVGFGVQAVGAASNLQQAVGAVESVYGAASASVQAFAQTSATSVGLAQSAYLGLSATVGAQLQGLGFEQAAAAEQSHQLITMGADLAATFGGDVSTAVAAVGSLLRGERDPIEQYGVAISAADVKARLAEKGLTGLTGASLKQAEATATLELLTEKTKNAHGAFGRESDTLAGKQARLSAQYEDVKARIGTSLLPMAERLFGFLTNQLTPGTDSLTSSMSARLGPALTAVGGFITGTVVPAAQSLYSWWAEKIAPHLAGAGRSALEGIRSALGVVGGAIDAHRPQLSALLDAFRRVAEFVGSTVVPIVGAVAGGAFRTLGAVISSVIGTVGGMVSAAQRVGSAIGSIAGAVDRAIAALARLAAKVASTPLGAVARALFSGPELSTAVPGLSGGVGGLGPGPLLTASLGTAGGSTSVAGLRRSWAPVVLDQRDQRVSVTVEGALDAPAVARQLERILAEHARRIGRAPSYAPGRL